MTADGAPGEDAIDRVVVGVAAQARPVCQKLLDRRLVETLIDRRAVLFEELWHRIAERRCEGELAVADERRDAGPVIAFDRLAISVGFCGSAP